MTPYLRKLRFRYRLAYLLGCVCAMGCAFCARECQLHDSWFPVCGAAFFGWFMIAAFGERLTFRGKIRDLTMANGNLHGPSSPFSTKTSTKPSNDSFWR